MKKRVNHRLIIGGISFAFVCIVVFLFVLMYLRFTGLLILKTQDITDIIPADRLMNWSVAGVPGGIPNRATICATLTPEPTNPGSTTGSISINSYNLTVTSVVDFQVGQGIKVPNAWYDGNYGVQTDLYTTITAINGNVLTLRTRADYTENGVAITHSDSGSVQEAINNCPLNQVVYAPTGKYLFERNVGSPYHSNVTIRGDGMGKTIFVRNSGTAFSFGSNDWPPPSAYIPVTAGATKGSKTITVDSTSATSGHPAFVVGGFILIGAGANPSFVHNLGTRSYEENLSMPFRVTALTSNTVTFQPALPFDFSSYSPKAGIFQIAPLTGVGLENFTIDLNGSGGYGIQFGQMWGSWIRDVEIKNSNNHLSSFDSVLNSEIIHCYFHDSKRGGPNTEGLDFYSDSSWNLIEDNIVYNAGGILIGDWGGGDSGNVIAYNLAYATFSGTADTAGPDIDLNHGVNNILNLIEGNIAGGVIADGYFGSASHYTLLRNWLTSAHPTATNGLHAIRLKHFSDYFSVIGNILGSNVFPTTGYIDNWSGLAYGGFYDAPQINSYDDGASLGTQTIYELGFPDMGYTGFTGILAASTPIDYSSEGPLLGSAQKLDLNVNATLIRHGNYDFFNNAVLWDPKIADHNIPNSLYLTSKPSWFGNLSWPPFDPASPNVTFDSIPAGYRYLHSQEIAFVPTPTYTFNVLLTGNGSGTVTGTGINCGVTCSSSALSGTTIYLSASPSSGSVLSVWSGACSGASTCVFTLNSNTTVTANFITSQPSDNSNDNSGSGNSGGGGGDGGSSGTTKTNAINVSGTVGTAGGTNQTTQTTNQQTEAAGSVTNLSKAAQFISSVKNYLIIFAIVLILAIAIVWVVMARKARTEKLRSEMFEQTASSSNDMTNLGNSTNQEPME